MTSYRENALWRFDGLLAAALIVVSQAALAESPAQDGWDAGGAGDADADGGDAGGQDHDADGGVGGDPLDDGQGPTEGGDDASDGDGDGGTVADGDGGTDGCPQLDGGCCVLIGQLIANRKPGAYAKLVKLNEELSRIRADGTKLCDVHFFDVHQSGKIRPKPKREEICRWELGLTLPPLRRVCEWNMTPDQETTAQAEWKTDMEDANQAWAATQRAHWDHVAEGKNVAMYLVDAHGTTCGSHCGLWTLGIDTDGLFAADRHYAHANSYSHADHKVCSHLVWDGSCYSGCTPAAGKHANWEGRVDCNPATTCTCSNRAGYDSDLWLGSSTREETTDGDVCEDFTGELLEAVDRAQAAGKAEIIIDTLDRSDCESSYSDSGYGHCQQDSCAQSSQSTP